MIDHLTERARLAVVAGFAIAMAVMEAATVFYIRSLVDRIEPYQANPLPLHDTLGSVELWREAATLVMSVPRSPAQAAKAQLAIQFGDRFTLAD